MTVGVSAGVGSSPSSSMNTGVGVAVQTFTGVGMRVPWAITSAVATAEWYVAVSALAGVGVEVTTSGGEAVTMFAGCGVGVPKAVASYAAVTARAAAVKALAGVGVSVSKATTTIGVGVGGHIRRRAGGFPGSPPQPVSQVKRLSDPWLGPARRKDSSPPSSLCSSSAIWSGSKTKTLAWPAAKS